MAKTPSISDAARIGQEVANKASKASKPAKKAGKAAAEAKADIVVTSFSLPEDLLHLLQDVAIARARSGKQNPGRRMSVSAIVVDLVERHRDELEAEL